MQLYKRAQQISLTLLISVTVQDGSPLSNYLWQVALLRLQLAAVPELGGARKQSKAQRTAQAAKLIELGNNPRYHSNKGIRWSEILQLPDEELGPLVDLRRTGVLTVVRSK